MDKLEKFLTKTLMVLVCLLVVVVIASVGFFFRVFGRDSYDDKYQKTWYCSEYDIKFTSVNKYFPNVGCRYYDSSIKDENVVVTVEDDEFFIDKEVAEITDGEECSEYIPYFKGDYDYSWGKFTVDVTKVYDEEYNYLKGKSLVFKKE